MQIIFFTRTPQGEFIQVCKIGEYMYGLTMAAIEQVAQQGLACVAHMTLEVSERVFAVIVITIC